MSDITPEVRLENIIEGVDVSGAPANRLEALIMGEDIEPVTRLEALIKNAISSGGAGIESESGEIIPESDNQNLDVSYSKAHDKPAFFFLLMDANAGTADDAVANSGLMAFFVGHDQISGGIWAGDTIRYGLYVSCTRGKTTIAPSFSNSVITTPYTSVSSSSITNYRYYSKLNGFRVRTGSATFEWKAGRTYKWLALWV